MRIIERDNRDRQTERRKRERKRNPLLSKQTITQYSSDALTRSAGAFLYSQGVRTKLLKQWTTVLTRRC